MTEDIRELVPNTARATGVPEAVLLPYQQRWVADEAPFKVCEKSRRTGLTWAEAADDVLIAAADKSAGGQNVYYIGTDKEMTEEYIDACVMWAKAYNRVATSIDEGIWDEADDDQHIRTFTIRFPNSGHKIVALASRPRKLRGRQGVLVGDEAAFQDNLDELLKAAMAFLIWGGKVRLISTHDGEDNAFNQLIQDIRAGKQLGVVHRVEFDQAVAEGLYKRVCLRKGIEWSQASEDQWKADIYAFYRTNADEELRVIPSQGGGKFLTRTLIERCMTEQAPLLVWTCKPEFTYEPAASRAAECLDWLEEHVQPELDKLIARDMHYIGSDFARSGDASDIVVIAESARLTHRVPFIIEMRGVPFEQQRQVGKWLIERLPRFTAGALDASGNGADMAEYLAQQFGPTRIHEIKLSQEWYRVNMPRVKAAFEDETIALPKHEDVLADLRAIVTDKGIAKVPANARYEGSDGLMRHGDIAVALALGLYAIAEIEPEVFEYHRVKAHPDRRDDPLGRDIRIGAGFKSRSGGLM